MGIKLPEFIRLAKISLHDREKEEIVQTVNPDFEKQVLVDSSLLYREVLVSNPELAKQLFQTASDSKVR